VMYNTQGHYLNQKATGSSVKYTTPGKPPRFRFIHKVILNGLETHTNYSYKVGSDAYGYSKIFHFHTWPAGNDWSPSLIIYGDLGVRNARSVPRLAKDVAANMYDAILHVGDIAYDMHENGGGVADDFFNMMEPIAASVPYMTCPGNHEGFANFSEYKARFEMPGDEKKRLHFSFNMGPIHFISINSEVWAHWYPGWVAEQIQWLEEDLKEANTPENRQQRPWVILFGHRPMYCSNSNLKICLPDFSELPVRIGYPKQKIPGIEDLTYKYGVDVFFWAHEHSYERTWPLYNNTVYNGSDSAPYTNPRAPVHITTGAAGQQEQEDPFKLGGHPYSAFRTSDYGYTRVKVFNSSHVYLEQVSDDKDGAIVDKAWIIKDKHGSYL